MNKSAATLMVVATGALLSPTVTIATTRQTLRLNWVEQRSKVYYSSTPMTFRVKDVVLQRTSWAVHGSFTNRSGVVLRIRRSLGSYYAAYDFGLAWSSGLGAGHDLEELRYSFARPRFPAQIRPGQSWSGVFGGRGHPPSGRLVYVVFGTFFPPGAPYNTKEFDWVTAHAFKI
jgi:hypothetical protein